MYLNLSRVNIRQICLKVNHKVRKYLCNFFFFFNHYIRNCCVLKLSCKFFSNSCSCFIYFTSCRAHSILCKLAACNTVFEMKFLIKLISSDLCKIISLRIKEHTI